MIYVYWCATCEHRVELNEPEPPEIVRCNVQGCYGAAMKRDYQAEAANISREGFR